MAITPGMTAGGKAAPSSAGLTKEERKVIIASSLGTVFEWYDFYLYGSLASIIAKQFFIGDPTTTFIFALMAFDRPRPRQASRRPAATRRRR